MSEQPFGARSPGDMLRTARERQGLHIAAMAASIKVSPRKLDALEHDRWDELPDATFIRALAQTVCRTLKIDAAPVLALLPRAGAQALDSVRGGLNAPFLDRPGREEARLGLGPVRPMVLAASVLMVAAVVVYVLPDKLWTDVLSRSSSPAVAAEVPMVAASAPESTPLAQLAEPAASAPAQPASSAAFMPAAVAPPASAPAQTQALLPGSTLKLRTRGQSWIEVRDGAGKPLLSRLVQAGEALDLDGAPPLRMTIGNAAVTQVDFRGFSVDLAPSTRDNVARVELK
jgi:cytoskeleton protein RodZ